MTIRVGVFGAGGRVGAAVCRAVATDTDLELVAAVDPHHSGIDLRQVAKVDSPNLQVAASADEFVRAGVDVAVDFTVVDAARQNLAYLAENGIHAVVGTTGFGDDDFASFRETFVTSNCIVAPNFAIGAVLMMKFAEMAAPFFESAEIIELHHDKKLDAPSGTAMMTVQRMAAASADWAADPTEKIVLAGVRGGAGPGGIAVHSVRLRGVVSHQEVLLGTTGQSLSIRHDSYDVSSFMPGILLAVKRIAEVPGLTLGLEPLLGI